MPTDRRAIFLTGSRGFIGRYLLAALEQLGHNVHCAEHNELPANKFYYDYIIHLAATTTTSDQFLPELFENNVVYAKKIMSCSPIRTIYASSTSAEVLCNPYAYTKRYIEHLGEQHENATGLRFFNVYGAGNNKGIVNAALEKEYLNVYGGNNVRDFIHISDVVRTIISSLDSKEKIIEVGTGTGMTIFQALHIIEIIKGSVFDIRVLDGVSTDMQRSVASKGIEGCLSFEDGIRLMWEGMQK